MMEAPIDKILVLDDTQIRQKINRISHEIYENNFKEKQLVLAGIEGQGYSFAHLISQSLASISSVEITVTKIQLDKLATQQPEVLIDLPAKELKKRCVILVDDVLNKGRTLAFALNPFLAIGVKKIEVAVLVNRSNTFFPITPTYTGYELATTLKDHVQVILGEKSVVYLC